MLVDELFLGIHVPLPRIAMPDVLPTRTDDWMTLGIVTRVAVMAHWLPDKATPVRYIIRVLAIIQATAVAYFWLLPDQFPHSATNHLDVILRASVWVMLLIPWIHALVYYVFPFRLWQHLALTLPTLAALAAITPMLAVLHALMLARATLIVLPVLYFALGVLVYVMVCIALYGWRMSWQTVTDKTKAATD